MCEVDVAPLAVPIVRAWVDELLHGLWLLATWGRVQIGPELAVQLPRRTVFSAPMVIGLVSFRREVVVHVFGRFAAA